MFSALQSAFFNPVSASGVSNSHPTIKKNKPVKTDYTSLPVSIPDDFLSPTEPAADSAGPILYSPIDWATSPIPENEGKYAVVLDNVLSPSECATLVSLAEASVPLDNPTMRGEDGGPWMPALVNVGMGFEVLTPEYRRSARIVWDSREVVDRLWARISSVREVREALKRVSGVKTVGRRDGDRVREWEFVRVNERLRFLRYGKGDFFKPHCDSPFVEKDYLEEGGPVKTLFTVHLYLNDSKAEVEGAELVGGATTLFSSDERRRLDVNPKAGRVLIFQHSGVLHSGDDVKKGVKYSVRTDIVYRVAKDEEKEEKDEEPFNQ